MTPITEQLIALREHYQDQLATHELKASQAREQLSHIHALLLDQLVPPDEIDEIPLPAFVSSSNLVVSASLDEIQTVLTPSNEEAVAVDVREPQPAIAAPPVEPIDTNEVLEAPQPSAETSGNLKKAPRPPKTAKPKRMTAEQPIGSTSVAPSETAAQGTAKADVSPFTPPAVAKKEPEGEPQESQGKPKAAQSKRTNRKKEQPPVAGKSPQPASVTVPAPVSGAKSTNRTNKEKSKGPRQTQPKADIPKGKSKASPRGTKTSLQKTAQYGSASMMESVKQVMQAHPGQVMNSRTVAAALYPELDEQTYGQLKNTLNSIFSKGYIEGFWDRVPNQRGAYRLK